MMIMNAMILKSLMQKDVKSFAKLWRKIHYSNWRLSIIGLTRYYISLQNQL